MKNCLFLVFCFFSMSAFATPTIEGLFRNGNNADIAGNIVAVTMMVEEITPENAEKTAEGGEETAGRYLKMVLSLERSSRVELLQVDYQNSRLQDSSVIKSAYVPHFFTEIADKKNIERSFFYSVMSTLLLNDSRIMSVFLKNFGEGYKTNRELMNKEKVELLQQYKNYLLATSGDATLKETLKASKQGDVEERVKAIEAINSGIYDKTDKIKLVKEEGQFLWDIELGNVRAFFTNEENRLKKMTVAVSGGKKLELNCGEYILFDGTHELPKYIVFKDQQEVMYRIQILSLNHFSDKTECLASRSTKYSAILSAKRGKIPPLKNQYGFLF